MHLPLEHLDDRGRPLACDRDLTVADAEASGARRADARAALRPAALLVWACVAMGLAGIWAVVLLLVEMERHMPKALGYAIALAIGTAAYACGAAIVRAPGIRVYRRGWLRLGLCPSCAYRITELEPEADGCRVCPECGGAWKPGPNTP